jgi:hypothetical protein
MRHRTHKYRDWEGTAAELADVAAAIEAEIGLPEGDTRPNERLVRHYVHIGIIGRAERRGKEAYFGFRQIVELLAARVLLNDGWPLAKIAEFVRVTDLDGLLGLLPKGEPPTPAQELVSRFQLRTQSEQRPASEPASLAVNPLRQSVDLLRRRQEVFTDGVQPEIGTWLRIELTPWCHVYIEHEVAHRTPPELMERLGRALTQTLIESIRRGDRK